MTNIDRKIPSMVELAQSGLDKELTILATKALELELEEASFQSGLDNSETWSGDEIQRVQSILNIIREQAYEAKRMVMNRYNQLS